MSKAKFAFFSLFLYFAAIIADVCIGAHGATAPRRVVMVVADYLDIDDIKNMDYLGKMSSKSSMALMNNRQPGKADASKSKLLIGTGKRLELGAAMMNGGSIESFGTLYNLAGGTVIHADNLVYTDIFALKNRNSKSEYNSYIGYLGEAINKNNGTACFIGNADTDVPNRSSMLMAIDSMGLIDAGETEQVLKTDVLFPYEKRTDYSKLAILYKQYMPASSFILIETGDMERLEAFRKDMSEQAYEKHKKDVLKDIDCFIKELVDYGGFDTLILISTFPSKADFEAGNKLTPIIVYEGGEGGLLYSASTRRAGIILNIDVADFVLNRLDYLDSSKIMTTRKDNPGVFLSEYNKAILGTSLMRLPVLTFYAIQTIITLLLLFIRLFVFKGQGRDKEAKLLRCLAYINITFPLTLLFLDTRVVNGDWIKYAGAVLFASCLIAVVSEYAMKSAQKGILFVCTLVFLGLSADILTGSSFIKSSVMGYDPIIGARFYGIGNEYAGVYAGSSIVVFGCILELRHNKNKVYGAVYFIGCTAILGLTFLGANFGGAMAGAFGYLLAYYLFYGIKFSKRNITLGFAVLAIAALLLVWLDMLGVSSSSHIGGIVKDTGTDGVRVIAATIERKLSMNLRLLRYTIWTKVLLCVIAVIAYMLYKPKEILKEMFRRHSQLKNAWAGAAASAIVGFFINDSGVVLAATNMIFVSFTMLIMLTERQESSNGL